MISYWIDRDCFCDLPEDLMDCDFVIADFAEEQEELELQFATEETLTYFLLRYKDPV